MVILGLNDHLWKEMYGNAWTGKISDISGLIFFPLLLEYLIPVRWISVLCTGVVFTLINTSEWCNQVWKSIFQLLYDILHLRIIAHAKSLGSGRSMQAGVAQARERKCRKATLQEKRALGMHS